MAWPDGQACKKYLHKFLFWWKLKKEYLEYPSSECLGLAQVPVRLDLTECASWGWIKVAAAAGEVPWKVGLGSFIHEKSVLDSSPLLTFSISSWEIRLHLRQVTHCCSKILTNKPKRFAIDCKLLMLDQFLNLRGRWHDNLTSRAFYIAFFFKQMCQIILPVARDQPMWGTI